MKINIPPFGWLEARKEDNKLIIEGFNPRHGYINVGSVGISKPFNFRADPFIVDSYDPKTGIIEISEHKIDIDFVLKLLNQSQINEGIRNNAHMH